MRNLLILHKCRIVEGGVMRCIATVLITLAMLSGCDDPVAYAPKEPLRVGVVKAEKLPIIGTATLTGEIKARIQSDLSFRISGRVASISADVGDHVEAGGVLATLDTTQLESNLKVAKASLHSAQATLNQSTIELDRKKSLLDRGFTTRELYDDAKQEYLAAKADMSNAKADLSSVQNDIDNAVLRAPRAGVVTARNAEVGQVMAAAMPVITFANDGDRDAVFDVPEALIAAGPPNGTITIHLLSQPNISAIGVPRELSQVVDPATGSIQVKIGIENTPPEMTLGAAVAGLGQFNQHALIRVRWTAFFTKRGEPAVWTINPDTNVASLTPIVIDSYQTKDILIKEGINPGDLVVVAGAQLLRPGQVVAPILMNQSTGGATQK
ncbi:efflux RND transporter periplasmic adaptor subunit [Hwanghaeella sp. LZ110]|jgi:RND family efflux transporter MFP subunit|uniref:efflux RND transporter periplasmic adaptor subunit n=1 Tax=Hwanghaeella sp. LZ110 TaxID=3402810 RepID=UPI003B66D4E3